MTIPTEMQAQGFEGFPSVHQYIDSLPEDAVIDPVELQPVGVVGPVWWGYPENVQVYLDSLPASATYISLSSMWIDRLPDLSRFKNLKVLDCSFNNFTSFPSLPDTLVSFNCQHNKLTQFPEINKKLVTLICSNNRITSMPENVPMTLKVLRFVGNPVYWTKVGQEFTLPVV